MRPRIASASLVAVLVWSTGLAKAEAADDDHLEPDRPATRPVIEMNRWHEDWSVLADPALRTEPGDGLKYIALRPAEPQSFVSLGVTLRERFEAIDAANFGLGRTASDDYLLQRLQVHADVHFDKQWQAFVQLEDARTFGKRSITPVDKNPLDLRLAYLAYSNTTDQGTFRARIGRQDFLFDLQRFVSSRDGPNVRQSFDAIWGDWESGDWRLIGFLSQPVQYENERTFDDRSNRHLRFDTLRVERHVFGNCELSAYYARYSQDGARYLDAVGNERRDVLDVRFAGNLGRIDWDLEAMGQGGSIGAKTIRAWALGARAGYTLTGSAWKPRIGFQADAASGDRRAGDGSLGTFNALFPNGYYFTLAGFSGFTNLLHLKPSLTVEPIAKLSVMTALGFQWRQTPADAIYVQGNVALPGTAGKGSPWTGAYGQLRADYQFDANLTGALEAVHFGAADAIRIAGGHNSDYLGLELRFGW